MAMVYDLPQVSPTAAPMNAAAAPQVENYAPKQGAQMAGAISEMAKAATTIQDDIDTANAQAAHNKLMDAANKVLLDPDNGFMTKSGKAAIDARSEALKALEDTKRQLSEGMSTNMQKFMFNRAADASMQNWTAKINSHTGEQTKVWRVGEAKAGMDNYRKLAEVDSVNYKKQGSDYQINKGMIISLANQVADTMGFGPEQRKALIDEETTKLHVNSIQNMLNTEGVGAEAIKEYYYKHKDEISGDMQPKLLHQINAAGSFEAGMTAVDAAWRKVMGDTKDINTPIKSAELFEALRSNSRLTGNKEAYAAAKEELHNRISAWNQQQTEINQAGEDKAWKMFNGGMSLARIMATPEWQMMGGEAQGKFRNTYEGILASRASRAAAEASRSLAEMEKQDKLLFRKNSGIYFAISDPNRLKNMSREQIAAMQPMFGMEATKHLLDKYEQLTKPVDGLNVVSTENMLKMAAKDAGIIPKDGSKPNESQSTQYAQFEMEIAKQVKVLEAQKKGKATHDDLQKVIDGVIINKVKIDEFGRDPEKPVTMVKPDDYKSAYVNLDNGKQVYISTIPAKERMKIMQALERKGMQTTEKNIATYWDKAGRPK